MERTTHDAALRNRVIPLQALFLTGLGGNEKSYLTFLSELSVHVRGFLRNRLQGQPSEIEHLLQQVLLAVHGRRETYLPDQPVTAWVFTIARYKLARGGGVMMRSTTP